MKKSEKIKQLEAQIQEYKWKFEAANDEIKYLSSTRESCPEPYFPKLSKTEAFDMVIRMLHTQPTSNPSLESVLNSADAIVEWYNKGETIPQPENKPEDWEEFMNKILLIPTDAAYNELKDYFLLIKK